MPFGASCFALRHGHSARALVMGGIRAHEQTNQRVRQNCREQFWTTRALARRARRAWDQDGPSNPTLSATSRCLRSVAPSAASRRRGISPLFDIQPQGPLSLRTGFSTNGRAILSHGHHLEH